MNATIQSNKTLVEQALEKFPKARRIAVENVSMWYRGTMEDNMNLEADAASYKWNAHTMSAIKWVFKHRNK